MAKEKLQGQAPSAEELAWLKHAQEEQQKAPERIEEAAKYLAAIVSICLTICFDKIPNIPQPMDELLIPIIGGLWMLAVVLSFFALFPTRYRYIKDSPEFFKYKALRKQAYYARAYPKNPMEYSWIKPIRPNDYRC